jgi:hypothetical protein
MMRRRRLWRTLLGILLSFLVALVYAAWPGRSTFTVSPETTYITGPINSHGYVDYVSALNERLSQGITPANNANVLIWQALGPHPESATMPAEYFKWLGIEQPPEEGEYFVSWEKFLKEQLKDEHSERQEELDGRQSRALRWPWDTANEPEVAGWLRRNERALEFAIEASRRADYYNPLVPKRTEGWSPTLLASPLPNVQRSREIAAALICRAMNKVKLGRLDDAWQDLLACHRLARLIARGGSLIEVLVGIAIDALAIRVDVSYLSHAELSQEGSITCLRNLNELQPMPLVADEMERWERFMLLDIMMQVIRHGTPALENLSRSSDDPPDYNKFTARLFSQSVNWDPALRNANLWYDRCASWARISDRRERQWQLFQITNELRSMKYRSTNMGIIEKSFMSPTRRGEFIGEVMISLLLPAFQKVREAQEHQEQKHGNLHLAFALAAYQKDHGRYPAKLDELAPKYLEKIPDDLFSGQPLIYKPTDKGYLLYSVGPNGIDDEGRGPDDEPRGDDFSVRMPVPEPKPRVP